MQSTEPYTYVLREGNNIWQISKVPNLHVKFFNREYKIKKNKIVTTEVLLRIGTSPSNKKLHLLLISRDREAMEAQQLLCISYGITV